MRNYIVFIMKLTNVFYVSALGKSINYVYENVTRKFNVAYKLTL